MTTAETIRPIIYKTYGRSAMSQALVEDLAKRIDAYDPDKETRDRPTMITLHCWNWFSGGTTAAAVAQRIEEALQ